MARRFWVVTVVVLGVWNLAFSGITVARAATVGELHCEGRDEPLGIDVAQPRLSWTIRSERRGELQSAYQVLVATSAEILSRDAGDLWDSSKVASARSYGLAYAGKALTSRTRCFGRSAFGTATGRPRPGARPPVGRWAS